MQRYSFILLTTATLAPAWALAFGESYELPPPIPENETWLERHTWGNTWHIKAYGVSDNHTGARFDARWQADAFCKHQVDDDSYPVWKGEGFYDKYGAGTYVVGHHFYCTPGYRGSDIFEAQPVDPCNGSYSADRNCPGGYEQLPEDIEHDLW